MRLAYHVLDVFTQTPLAGNPLAVVLDADGLDAARMQAIAREFNLSETVFVLEPRDATNTARIRIFTPRVELPFAGHPTVGAAALLAQLRAGDLLRARDLDLVLEETVGAIRCTVRHLGERTARTLFGLPKLPERLAVEAPSKADMAAALGVETSDLGFGAFVPAAFSAGVAFWCLPLASRAAIARAAPVTPRFAEIFALDGTAKTYLYTDDTTASTHDFHARMFASGLGVAEDPATGSAAAAFAGAVMAFDPPRDGTHGVTIAQGTEMGRPSLISLGLTVEGGALTAATIAGAAVMIASGTLDL